VKVLVAFPRQTSGNIYSVSEAYIRKWVCYNF